jgi:hypothetical protein
MWAQVDLVFDVLDVILAHETGYEGDWDDEWKKSAMIVIDG